MAKKGDPSSTPHFRHAGETADLSVFHKHSYLGLGKLLPPNAAAKRHGDIIWTNNYDCCCDGDCHVVVETLNGEPKMVLAGSGRKIIGKTNILLSDYTVYKEITRFIADPPSFYGAVHRWEIELDPEAHAQIIERAAGSRPVDPSLSVTFTTTTKTYWVRAIECLGLSILNEDTPAELLAA